MDREDWESIESCVECGTAIAPNTERGFQFGVGNVLCCSCAEERGGQYDAERDAWTVPPDIADLSDEAYGSAPLDVRR